MPTSFVKTMADKHNMSVADAEKKWQEAKDAAATQGQKDNYAYVTQVFKNLIGEKTASVKSAFLTTDDLREAAQRAYANSFLQLADLLTDVPQIHDLMLRSSNSCPSMKNILVEGKGSFHMANLKVRADGQDFSIEADWADDVGHLIKSLVSFIAEKQLEFTAASQRIKALKTEPSKPEAVKAFSKQVVKAYPSGKDLKPEQLIPALMADLSKLAGIHFQHVKLPKAKMQSALAFTNPGQGKQVIRILEELDFSTTNNTMTSYVGGARIEVNGKHTVVNYCSLSGTLVISSSLDLTAVR